MYRDSEPGGRECASRHPDQPSLSELRLGEPFLEGRQIQAGCTCLESRIGNAEVGALPTPSANLTINLQEITMTISQYLPPWLVRRLTKPRPRKFARPQMKRRQILPTLPKTRKTFGRK